MVEQLPFCARCGEKSVSFKDNSYWLCSRCGFQLYFNIAAACGALLKYNDSWLLLRRAGEPAKNKLDLPGGFVDPKESLEEALLREIKEEIGVTPLDLQYFGSYANQYLYKGIHYRTCDVFFTGTLKEKPVIADSGEVSELLYLKESEIQLEQIAFPSMVAFVKDFFKK